MKIFLKGVKEFIKVIISIYLTNSFNLISKIPFISPGDAFATCLALYMIFIDLLLEYISEKITSYKCNLEIVFYQKDYHFQKLHQYLKYRLINWSYQK